MLLMESLLVPEASTDVDTGRRYIAEISLLRDGGLIDRPLREESLVPLLTRRRSRCAESNSSENSDLSIH